MNLYNYTKNILPPKEEPLESAKKYVDSLAKPLGSLGHLETLAISLSGIYGNLQDVKLKKCAIVMAGDHGVCEEEVASAPQYVTYQQAINMTTYQTGVSAIAKAFQIPLKVVDVGIAQDTSDTPLILKKVAMGTNNMRRQPAMTREQAIASIWAGIETIEEAINEGFNCFSIGEMGIGNTTPSTAILSVYSSLPVEELTGIGANFPIEKLPHKAKVISDAILLNQPNPQDPIDVLAKVGGFDIGGMTGAMLAAAKNHKAIIVDGFISTISAILAQKIAPSVSHYLIASHHTMEKGGKEALRIADLHPPLHMNMRLGEGSGSILMFPLLDAALGMYQNMISFEASEIKPL